ncbi:hypothetical protein UlMin_009522 [Ulmus minor]
MELPSSSRKSPSNSRREKFVRLVISPAIREQTCPICLEDLHVQSSAVLTNCKHAFCVDCIRKWSYLGRKCPLCNSEFNSWFYHISLSSGNFHTKRLPALSKERPRRFRFLEENRQRTVINPERRRTRPLPFRRSFGRLGSVDASVIAERKLQWRASVYEQCLRAVHISPTSSLEQNISGNSSAKDRILRRIEPWIKRELQAILGDPDPSVIVHVAKSLYIAALEKKVPLSSGQADMGDQFLRDLRPFLLDKTEMFWHELRCFVESPFTMETYDAVVEYTR